LPLSLLRLVAYHSLHRGHYAALTPSEKELKTFENQSEVQDVLEKGRLLYKELALAKGLGR
jgi:hypothetical protein